MKSLHYVLTILLLIPNAFAAPLGNKSDAIRFYRKCLSKSIGYLKNDSKSKKDKLLQAIINRDLNTVKQEIPKNDLNIEAIQSWIKTDKKKSGYDAVCIGHTYLSVAVLNSTVAKNNNDKNVSITIIEELLKNKANPQAKLGYAVFIDGKDYLMHYPLTHEAVKANCSEQVLELLFKYGAKPNFKLNDWASTDSTLQDVAKEFNCKDLKSVIKKYS